MSTIRMRDIMALVVVAAILIAMIPLALPGVVFGATSDNLTGKFTLGNSDPIVSNVAIYAADHGGSPVTNMTPLVEYAVKVTVADTNSLQDLKTITVQIFHDADSDNSTDDRPVDSPAEGVTLTWTEGASEPWTISSGGSTSWDIVEAACIQPPNLGLGSGDFWFNFVPGKIATEATDWDVYVVAMDDESGTGASYHNGAYDMNWYGEINVITANATWTGVTAGMDFTHENADVPNIQVNYIANGDYKVAVTTDSSWNSAALNTAGSPTANQFSLKANNVAGVPTGNLVTTSTGECVIDNLGAQTSESGLPVNTNALYLKLGSPFVNGAYTGQVCYTIIDR